MKKENLKNPPMGWNSWDCYGAGVTEKSLLGNAEYMAKNLKKYGWEYVVCDIQWYEPNAKGNNYNNFTELCMDEFSRLVPAENRFPSAAGGKGFSLIAEKIHAMGLKFGIHIMRGIPRQAVHRNTKIMCENITARDIAAQFSVCPWNTDMYGVNAEKDGAQEYYNSIVSLYASWGVDFIKCDDISNTEFKPDNPYSAEKEIELLKNAIENSGREIVLSLSPGPAPVNMHKHLSENANMWRMSGDFWDRWDKLYEMFSLCEKWAPFVEDGAYPDCDMLPLGKLCVDGECFGGRGRYSNFTRDEQKTLMTLWCIFRSPLFMGGEMRDNDEFTFSLLTNEQILEMNKLSRGAHLVSRNENSIVWEADCKSGGKYIALFNISDSEKKMCFDVSLEEGTPQNAVNLWSGEKMNIAANCKIEATVSSHGAAAFKIY